MERTKKEEIVAELRAKLEKAPVAILCDFRGMKVADVDQLRRELWKEGVEYRVVKNTLARLAMEKTPMLEALEPHLGGPTAIAFAQEDPVAPARVLARMAKEIAALTIKGGYLDGRALDRKGVEQLATMPGKAELRARFLGLLCAPASSLLRVFAGVPTGLARVLEARRRQLAGEA